MYKENAYTKSLADNADKLFIFSKLILTYWLTLNQSPKASGKSIHD
jgi:hypothetical protein